MKKLLFYLRPECLIVGMVIGFFILITYYHFENKRLHYSKVDDLERRLKNIERVYFE